MEIYYTSDNAPTLKISATAHTTHTMFYDQDYDFPNGITMRKKEGLVMLGPPNVKLVKMTVFMSELQSLKVR